MAADLSALEEELQRDPSSRRFVELAREYQRLGRLDEALALCEAGLGKHPSQAQARLIAAQLYLAKGRLEDGKASIERILLALPDHVPANHLAGEIFESQGEYERALRHYKVVDLFDPGRPDVAQRIDALQQKLASSPDSNQQNGRPVSEVSEPDSTGAVSAGGGISPEEGLITQEVFAAPTAERPVATASPPAGLAAPPEAKPAFEAATSPEEISFAGTVRMPQVRHSPPEQAVMLRREAEEEDPFPSTPSPLQNEGFADLLHESEEEPLGAELLDVHEQTLMSLPPVSGPNARTHSEAPSPSRLPPPAVPLPSSQREEAHSSEEPAAEPEEAMTPGPGLNTTTLAELYASQGFPEKAVEIYQRVLLQDPDQPDVQRKVQDLKLRMSGEAPELPEIQQEDVRRALRQRRVSVLEGWLKRVKEEQHV